MEQVINQKHIRYLYSQKDWLDECLTFMNNHPFFTKIFFPDYVSFISLEDGYFYAEDFDSLVNFMIQQLYQDLAIILTKESLTNLEKMGYYNYMVYHYDYHHRFIRTMEDVDENYVLEVSAPFYYSNRDQFKKFLLESNFLEKEKIVRWLKNHHRISLFLDILSFYDKAIDEYYPDFYSIYPVLKDSMKNIYSSSSKRNDSFLPFLSEDSLNNDFLLFLSIVDTSGKWRQIYQKGRENSSIVFEYLPASDVDNMSNVSSGVLHLYCNHTIDDFRTLAHEFCHYVSSLNGEKNTIFSEMPSLYFEYFSLSFLKEIGYSSDVLKNIYSSRKNWLRDVYWNLSTILPYLEEYHLKKALNEEDLLQVTKRLFSSHVKDSFFLERIDMMTKFMIQNGLSLIRLTSYLIGDSFIECMGDALDIPKMISITENLNIDDFSIVQEEDIKILKKTNL